MTINAPKLGSIIRSERRRQNVTQRGLAKMVQSTQPQISALEKGIPGILTETKVKEIAKVLELDLGAIMGSPAKVSLQPAVSVIGFCSNSECPTVFPFAIGGDVFLRPQFLSLPKEHATGCHCRICGEVIIFKCERCDAPLAMGYHCGVCGEPYLHCEALPPSIQPKSIEDIQLARSKVLDIPAPEVYEVSRPL